MADDLARRALDEIRERQRLVTTPSSWTTGERLGDVSTARSTLVRADAPRLLAALDAVLKVHEREPLYGCASTEDEPGNCPHDPDVACHFEAGDGSGEWLCEGRPEGAVCPVCTDGEGGERMEWPCPTVQAITRELAGEAPHDD